MSIEGILAQIACMWVLWFNSKHWQMYELSCSERKDYTETWGAGGNAFFFIMNKRPQIETTEISTPPPRPIAVIIRTSELPEWQATVCPHSTGENAPPWGDWRRRRSWRDGESPWAETWPCAPSLRWVGTGLLRPPRWTASASGWPSILAHFERFFNHWTSSGSSPVDRITHQPTQIEHESPSCYKTN